MSVRCKILQCQWRAEARCRSTGHRPSLARSGLTQSSRTRLSLAQPSRTQSSRTRLSLAQPSRTARLLATLAVCLLSACSGSLQRAGSSRAAGSSQPAPVPAPQGGSQPFPKHEGRPFDVQIDDSLLTILAYRGGTLSKAGHNHVIASHAITGTFYVPADVDRTTFELHVPVAELSIDEAELRAKEGPDFPPDVPESAKEGTRRNMLGEALLKAAQFPEIVLTSDRIVRTSDPSTVEARINVGIRGEMHSLTVPVHFELRQDQLTVTAAVPVKQSELGLTPFSALLGALQVQDEMQIRISILARPAHLQSATAARAPSEAR